MFAFRGVQKGVGLSKIIASSRRRRGYWHGAAAAAAASKMNGKTCNNYLRPPSAAAVGIRFFFSPSSSTEINNNNGINMDPTLAQVGTTTTSGGGGGGDLLPSSSSSSSRSARRGRGSPAILLQQLKHHQPNAIVPVSAIHAAQTIDLHKLMTQQQLSSSDVFDERKSSSSSSSSTTKQMFGKNSIVIRLADNDEDSVGTATTTTATDRSNSAARYVAVFRFGSIVFFNVAPPDAAKMTRAIKKLAASEPVPVGAERKEQFGVLVTRDLDTAAMTALEQEAQHQAFLEPVTGDYCVVPELDMNGVAVISTIMAQTVALDSYSDTVDELLTNFARINSTVSKTGSFTSTDKSFLFKTVAQNNSIFIDMISKVRIKDRSDTAWNLTKYETIHYGLKEEFVRAVVFLFVGETTDFVVCRIATAHGLTFS